MKNIIFITGLSLFLLVIITGCSSSYDISKDIKEDCIKAIEYTNDYLDGLIDKEDAAFHVGLQYNGKCSDDHSGGEDDNIICTSILSLEQDLDFGTSKDIKEDLKELEHYCK